MQYLKSVVYWGIVGSVVVLTSAFAQVAPPGAGSLLNQIEQNRPNVSTKTVIPEKEEAPKPARLREEPAGLEVTLKSVSFDGNRLLSDQQLLNVIRGKLGRPLKFSELQEIPQEVANAYREAGWVVRAYLPKQDLTEGVLLVKVIEAKFGGVEFSSEENASVPLPMLSARVTAVQSVDSPINLPSIERATLLIEDLPGMSVTTSLAPGHQDDQSLLLVNIAAKPRWQGDVGLDNMGSHATGVYRTLGNLIFFSPARLGDQMGINFAHTSGSDYFRLGYNLPVGNDGWRIGINASGMNYKLVAREFVSMDGHGQSTTQGLEASYPLVRSRVRNLNFTTNIDLKSFANFAAGTTTSRYSTRSFTAGLNGYVVDSWLGNGMSSASLNLSHGKVNLNGSPNQDADASTTQTQGSFSKLRYALSRQQVLTEQTALTLSLTGQRASKNLDSSEKFFLGGGAGVRAFPSGEGGGSQGDMLNVEWRWSLRSDMAVAAFVDWGQVRINKFNDYAGAPVLNQYALKGSGLSLTFAGERGWTGKAVWASRIGSNPNPSSSGADQDGTFIKNRIWLQATLTR